MSYLPVNNSILVVGGRNDELCKVNITPLLNDLHLYLLDQKVWINVKYSFNSDRMDFVGNHAMSVITDGDNYERVLIFGGICNTVKGLKPSSTNLCSPSMTRKEKSNISSGPIKTQDAPSVDMNQVSSFLSNRTFLINVQQRSSGKSFFKEDANKQHQMQKTLNPASNLHRNEKLIAMASALK